MPFFDMPLEQLEQYQPPRQEPDDFGAFWQQTLSEARQFPLHAAFERVDSLMPLLEVYDVTYSGFGGQPIKGWFILPVARSGKLPCIVEYIGYGGGRGLPVDWLHWAVAGYAHFVMDTRGQGSTWRNGDTPDNVEQTGNPQYPGVMTRGILDPHTYYYRRVYTDAVRAVEAARSHPTVDADRVVVLGGSQGGGITLAVAGLMPDLLAALPDVPFLCHYRRATQIINTMPYAEISAYLKTHRDKTDAVFRTLSYFDGVNFAARANAPALFSVGLMDTTCPPSTVYAAYNHYAGARQIAVYEYNEHEGGGSYHHVRKLQFLQAVLQS